MEQTVQFLQRLVSRLTRAQPLMLYSDYMNALMDKAELQEPKEKRILCIYVLRRDVRSTRNRDLSKALWRHQQKRHSETNILVI